MNGTNTAHAMNVESHLEQARHHLEQAVASPIMAGSKKAESARAMLRTSLTFVRLAGEEIDEGRRTIAVGKLPPSDHRCAAANDAPALEVTHG